MNEAMGSRGQTDLGKIEKEFRDTAGKIGDAAVDKAESAAQNVKQAGAEQVKEIAETAGRVADDLQKQSPLLADYLRDASKHIEELGDALRDRTVGDMLSSATEYGRKEPILLFAGAAVMGFALSRFVRSGLSPSSSTGTVEDREAVKKSTGLDV